MTFTVKQQIVSLLVGLLDGLSAGSHKKTIEQNSKKPGWRMGLSREETTLAFGLI